MITTDNTLAAHSLQSSSHPPPQQASGPAYLANSRRTASDIYQLLLRTSGKVRAIVPAPSLSSSSSQTRLALTKKLETILQNNLNSSTARTTTTTTTTTTTATTTATSATLTTKEDIPAQNEVGTETLKKNLQHHHPHQRTSPNPTIYQLLQTEHRLNRYISSASQSRRCVPSSLQEIINIAKVQPIPSYHHRPPSTAAAAAVGGGTSSSHQKSQRRISSQLPNVQSSRRDHHRPVSCGARVHTEPMKTLASETFTINETTQEDEKEMSLTSEIVPGILMNDPSYLLDFYRKEANLTMESPQKKEPDAITTPEPLQMRKTAKSFSMTFLSRNTMLQAAQASKSLINSTEKKVHVTTPRSGKEKMKQPFESLSEYRLKTAPAESYSSSLKRIQSTSVIGSESVSQFICTKPHQVSDQTNQLSQQNMNQFVMKRLLDCIIQKKLDVSTTSASKQMTRANPSNEIMNPLQNICLAKPIPLQKEINQQKANQRIDYCVTPRQKSSEKENNYPSLDFEMIDSDMHSRYCTRNSSAPISPLLPKRGEYTKVISPKNKRSAVSSRPNSSSQKKRPLSSNYQKTTDCVQIGARIQQSAGRLTMDQGKWQRLQIKMKEKSTDN